MMVTKSMKKRLIDLDELIQNIEADMEVSVTGRENMEAVKNMMEDIYDDVINSPAVNIEDRIFSILKAQDEAEDNGKEEFTCPLCGGEAYWFRSMYNNHLHIRCKNCSMRMDE